LKLFDYEAFKSFSYMQRYPAVLSSINGHRFTQSTKP